MTRSSLMHETGLSKLVHWDNPEGWDGEGGGRGVWDGVSVSVWQKPPQYCNIIGLQIKINKLL